MVSPHRAGSNGFVRQLTKAVAALNASTLQNARRLVALLATEDPDPVTSLHGSCPYPST